MTLLKKIALILLVLGVMLIGGVFFILNTGPQVEATWDEQDFHSGIERSQIVIDSIDEINLETLANGNFSVQDLNEIEDSFTSQEMSALISQANEHGGPIRNVNVSFDNNGEGQVSFELSDHFVDFLQNQAGFAEFIPDHTLVDTVTQHLTNMLNNRPVYAQGNLSRASSNAVDIQINQLTIGRIPLTSGITERVELETTKLVNRIISQSNGFSIEELKVEDGRLNYKGTLPKHIKGERIR